MVPSQDSNLRPVNRKYDTVLMRRHVTYSDIAPKKFDIEICALKCILASQK